MTSYTAEGWWYLDYHNSGGIYALITERGTAAFDFNYSVLYGTNDIVGIPPQPYFEGSTYTLNRCIFS